jgi:hypothetical protein
LHRKADGVREFAEQQHSTGTRVNMRSQSFGISFDSRALAAETPRKAPENPSAGRVIDHVSGQIAEHDNGIDGQYG